MRLRGSEGETHARDTKPGEIGRLARFPSSRVTKWFVVAFWIVVLAAAVRACLASCLTSSTTRRRPGCQKTRSRPGWSRRSRTSRARTSSRRSSSTSDPAGSRRRISRPSPPRSSRFNALEPVKRDAVGPIPSSDSQALQVIVPVDAGEDGWDSLGTTVTQMRDAAKDTPAGLSMHVTGPVGYAADSSEAFAGIDGKLLYSAMAVVIVILLITYRSPILWLVPVLSAGTALFVAQGVIYFLADGEALTVNAQSAGILTVIVFGAGTDYALLLVARYREELRRHEDRHEAMAFALHRAGPAIFASGATVIAAGMLCLLFATMSSTKGLGPVAAIGVGVGLLVMLTLLPALLVVLRHRVFWPVRPTYGSVDHTRDGGLGTDRSPHRPCPAPHLGRHHAAARDCDAGRPSAECGRPFQQGFLLHDPALGRRRGDRCAALPGRGRFAGARPDRRGARRVRSSRPSSGSKASKR